MTQAYGEPTYGYVPPSAPPARPATWPVTATVSLILFWLYLVPLTVFMIGVLIWGIALFSNPRDQGGLFGGYGLDLLAGGLSTLVGLFVLPFLLFPTVTAFLLLTRRRWSRIMHTVAYALPLLGIASSLTSSGEDGGIVLVMFLAGVVPLVLLWLPASNAFFYPSGAVSQVPPPGYWPPTPTPPPDPDAYTKSGFPQPGFTQPGFPQPGTPQPDTPQFGTPSPSQPDTPTPGQPDFSPPGFSQPTFSPPNVPPSGFPQPGTPQS